MSFYDKKEESKPDMPQLRWLEPSENPWGIRVLDLRPITQGMLSTSGDLRMAANAMSYGSEDGMVFVNESPYSDREISAEMSFVVDPFLAPGVLFVPSAMEHKWAIFFYHDQIIFVRSWLRKVAAVAYTSQENGRLSIQKIRGRFLEDEDEEPDFTRSIAKYLLVTHAGGGMYPAPLPGHLASDLYSAGLWAMSLFGSMAFVGLFDAGLEPPFDVLVRSNSLLHIATARSDFGMITQQLENGVPIDLPAKDGLAPLHWALAAADTRPMMFLLKAGADPNVRSVEGVTPIMNAVQSGRISHLMLLLEAGGDVNAKDDRGFTALHRAAEMGQIEIVRELLKIGADPAVEAAGYTPLSLAQMRGEDEIASLLS